MLEPELDRGVGNATASGAAVPAEAPAPTPTAPTSARESVATPNTTAITFPAGTCTWCGSTAHKTYDQARYPRGRGRCSTGIPRQGSAENRRRRVSSSRNCLGAAALDICAQDPAEVERQGAPRPDCRPRPWQVVRHRAGGVAAPRRDTRQHWGENRCVVGAIGRRKVTALSGWNLELCRTLQQHGLWERFWWAD